MDVMTHDENRVFSLSDIQRLSRCKATTLNFDLSSLDADYFDPLLSALCRFAPQSISGLGFNADLSIRERSLPLCMRGKDGRRIRNHPAIEFESSALKNCRSVVPRLIGALSRILPKSVSLRKLKFRSLNLRWQEFDVLAQSIGQCKSLHVLSFRNIRMDHLVFDRLTRAMKKLGIRTLKCRGCCLDDKISNTLIGLIRIHQIIQRDAERRAEFAKNRHLGIVCLSVIDFRRNLFTNQFIETIGPAVTESSMRKIDLRENPEIQPTGTESSKFLMIDPPPRRTPEEREIDHETELEEENRKLKDIISEFAGGKNVVALQRDLYAIGDRTPELIDHLIKLDMLREKMEAQEAAERRSPRPSKMKFTPKRRIRHKPVSID
jgi:hypothetical protein